MKRRARCWICGVLFEAERGSLPRGARFTCEGCARAGLRNAEGTPPERSTLSRALYEKHGVPYLELADVAIEEEVLRLVPEDFARHHSLIPVMLKTDADEKGGKKTPKASSAKRPDTQPRPVALVVAMSDPGNRFAVEAIRRRIGLPIQTFVSTWAEIAEAIGDHYLKIAITDEPATE